MVNLRESINQKEHPPLSKDSHMTNVSVDVTVFMVGNVDERDSKFDVRFSIQLKW